MRDDGMKQQALDDLAKLRMTVRRVGAAASAESKAFRALDEMPGSEALAALHQAHHAELDAIQQMLMSLDLFERRNPEVWTPDGQAERESGRL